MASKRWKTDITYAMTPFKLLTWPIGLWPLQVYNVYSLVRCVLAICFMCVVVILPSMEFHMGCTDAEENINCLMLICCGIVAVLKTIWFRVYADNLTINYRAAINDYQTIELAEQRTVMRKHAFVGRILSCFMVCFSYFGCIVFSLIPLLGHVESIQLNMTDEEITLKYPIPSRCALDYFNIPMNMHRILCFLELILLLITSTCNHGSDSLFLNITLHICGQVKILKTSFVNFDITKPQIHDRFNELLKKHCRLMQMAKRLVDTISFVLLVQLFISSILLCIMGFQFILALKMKDSAMMAKSSMVLNTFLTQLTVYSFVGDYLKSQMEDVGLSIYQCVWYVFPAKLTKNISFVIMRAQSPIKLEAGNFIVVNLSTYMNILKTSMSYLSVLRVIIEV